MGQTEYRGRRIERGGAPWPKVMRIQADLVDERLCAEHDREGEALGVFGVRFGGVDRDAEVVGGDDERVAFQRDAADVGVVCSRGSSTR
jgi:hypothetical protein